MDNAIRKTGSRRNGTIDLMRFVFCMEVILYHIAKRVPLPTHGHFNFFLNGKIGVEFFFLVSGFLMAASASRAAKQSIAGGTGQFMLRKVAAIFPSHCIVFVLALGSLLFYLAHDAAGALKIIWNSLPSFFFIQKTGVPVHRVIRPEWYIEAMLWMMLIIYPLILRFRERFTRIACPVLCVFLVGYMTYVSTHLGGTERYLFGNTIPKVYVRAFAELCGGAFCFEAAQLLKRLHLKKSDIVVLTLLELGCYLLTLVYTVSDLKDAYEVYFFYILAVAITLSFSGVTLTARLFSHGVFAFLGRFSLPLYLAQSMFFAPLRYSARLQALSPWGRVAVSLALTFGFGILAYALSRPLDKHLRAAVNRRFDRAVL
ncbi:MAG: acyltransferase [Clostridia bacterium]|nr:acyltransferase [Clostridia bacterium]